VVGERGGVSSVVVGEVLAEGGAVCVRAGAAEGARDLDGGSGGKETVARRLKADGGGDVR
jgi:hypothetical protein